MGAPGDIIVSLAVRELCIGKPFEFSDNGRHELKGMTEPAAELCCQAARSVLEIGHCRNGAHS